MTDQEKLNNLRLYYQGKPVAFFEDVLGTTLDDQQKEMLQLVKPGCRIMVKSAKGTGKTFILAGLVFYFEFCYADVFIRTLSPSYDQLLAVFMRECIQHQQRMPKEIAKHFVVQHDKVYLKDLPTNMMECVSAKTTKQERLGGMHSAVQIFLFDEASGIPDETYYMCLTSLGTALGGGFVIGASNPERGEESFYYNLFAKNVNGWSLLTFTAMASSQVKKTFIDDIENLYGEDSDEYRVAILGEFPRSDGSMYIPMSLVEKAVSNVADARHYRSFPIIIGADISRSKSGDKTVFVVRQGTKILDIVSFNTDDTMESVARLRDLYFKTGASVIYMDADGVGGPVADRCRELLLPVVDIRGSLPSSDPRQYANVRTQCWGEMREWLPTGDIPDHYELKKELGTMRWGYSNKMQEQLASKKKLVDSRGRKINSPDHADALAYTFFDSSISQRRKSTKARIVKRRPWTA